MEADNDSPMPAPPLELYEACKKDNLEAVAEFLQKNPSAVNYLDDSHAPPLITVFNSMYEAKEEPQTKYELIKLLISHGAKVNLESRSEGMSVRSPLDLLFNELGDSRELNVLKLLLEAGKCL